MKKALFTALFAFMAMVGFAQQKEEWPALESFHTVMSQTFHPAEKGDLKPIMARSGEMVEKAIALKKSAIPASYNKPGVKKILSLLAKESKSLDKMVKNKKSEADLTKALTALHERFHQLVEKCMH
ncbi:MAG: hypothetical protein J0L99_05810 [Chitinophagales bacterium]|nr:hypothetical protein [Chitinophagales bacterium]